MVDFFLSRVCNASLGVFSFKNVLVDRSCLPPRNQTAEITLVGLNMAVFRFFPGANEKK